MNAIVSDSLAKKILGALLTRFTFLDAAEVSVDTDLMGDLGLDSMQLVQLLVDMEIEHGISIPESALERADFSTAAALAAKINSMGSSSAAAPAELDIKVHCFVSCLCEPIKRIPGIDHRPFYFGVWDAEVFVDKQHRLSYHSDNVDHGFFVEWYRLLYGIRLSSWYDPQLSKLANLQRLQQLLQGRRPQQWVMVMLDLYQLPERENKFNKNPFPHYVMLENTTEANKIWMWDPDFRWQGALDRQRVFNAVMQPSVAGGYLFSTDGVAMPEHQMVDKYFITCLNRDCNPMTDAVRNIIHAHIEGRNGIDLAALPLALRELPVLAIRKYAYEHGLAFFWRDLGLPDQEFEKWCLVIEQLVKGYDRVQFLAMKYAKQMDEVILSEVEQCLNEQNAREFSIKNRLAQAHDLWRYKYFHSGADSSPAASPADLAVTSEIAP